MGHVVFARLVRPGGWGSHFESCPPGFWAEVNAICIDFFGALGGSPTSAEPSPRSVEPSFASAGGQLQNLEPQPQRFRGGPKVTLWRDPPWGAWFSQALAGQVVGVRTLRAAPRGFGPKGRRRGPAEGGRGEVNLPL